MYITNLVGPRAGSRNPTWAVLLALVLASAVGCGDDSILAGPSDGQSANGQDSAGEVDPNGQGDGAAGGDGGDTDAGDAAAADSDSADIQGSDTVTDDATDGGATDTAASDSAADDAAVDATATGDALADDAGAEDSAADDTAGADTPGDAEPSDTSTADTGATCDSDSDCKPSGPCLVSTCAQGACAEAPMADGSVCSDGNACTTGDACASGACVAGSPVNCSDGNACTDNGCDPTNGTCVTTPNNLPCDDGNACTAQDVCKSGVCAGAPTAACNDGNPCTNDACDPASGCTATDNSAPCGDGDKCLEAAACAGGSCVGKPVACDDENPCTKDACNPSLGCVFSAIGGVPCDDGNACSAGDLCNNGLCAAGSAVLCSDNQPCTDDSCDKATGCQHLPNTAACDDGSACTAGDVCQAGACMAGAPVACDDGNPCTDDACNPASGCSHAPNTLPCTTGNACDSGACSAGTCKPNGQKSCNDGNPCTTDICDASLGCVNKPVADGTTCAKGDACVGDSLCKVGKCETGPKTVCDDGNLCTDDICDAKSGGCNYFPNTAPCDDGNACTVGDACGVVTLQGAKCIAGKSVVPAVDCDDKNPCTSEVCDTAKGCQNLPAPAGTACNDGNVCTQGEVCASGKCQNGSLAGCDDSNPCTADNCDPATGKCSWSQVTGACDDGNPCTTSDACNGLKCAGMPAVCDDKNPCTADTCDATTGKCVASPQSGATCDDSNACTTGDACAAGKCTGQDKACSDGNVCTDDACNPATGACTSTNNTVPCTTGDLCTSGGVCSAGACKAGSTPKCDDNNPCTTDSCDSKTGACSYVPGNDGATCDDGLACSSASACKNGTCTPQAACTLFSDSFDCAAPTAWSVTVPNADANWMPARKVKWAVDQLAAVPGNSTCTLNYNNDKNYCDSYTFGSQQYCQLPKGTATSPIIDLTVAPGLNPTFFMDIYYDVDVPPNWQAGFGAPRIRLLDAGNNNAELASWSLPLASGEIKKWKNGYKIEMPQAKNKKVRIEASLAIPGGIIGDSGNLGIGVYLDNIKLEATYAAEGDCTDGVDNDGNGKTDCADFACTGKTECLPVIAADNMACTSKNWLFAQSDGATVWAIDKTPASPAPKTGDCTLNYNNGNNYVVGSMGNPKANGGTATWANKIDLAGKKKVYVKFWENQTVEPNLPCQNVQGCNDRTYLQISTDGFAGCGCAANQTCSYANNLCNTNNTKTYLINKDKTATWQFWLVEISDFGGKSVNLRWKFDTADQYQNNHAGPFIDDFAVIGQ
ncbi:MAG: hypothetical protein HY902_05195 [Deltaproteobacteria bacterium]|nr:hypothetical protein [Deltaproteobacteria bacterium]